MANTYVAIATTTVGAGGAANIEFTSIPGTYTDLLVKYSLRETGYSGVTYDWLKFRFNGSSSAVYSSLHIGGSGSSTFTNLYTSQDGMRQVGVVTSPTAAANTFANGEIYIPNYTSSNNKTVLGDAVSEDNATQAIAVLGAGQWANTSAITSISLFPENGTTWVQYSTATLYGIKNS